MTTPTRGGGPYPSFQTNVNRTKTKRWVEAKSFSYDGDEWGDEDEYDEPEPQAQPQHAPPPGMGGPGSRPHPPYGGPPRPSYGPPPGRGLPMQARGRPSFDRDDRPPFPPHQGGFEGPYPTPQRSPFGTPPDHPRHSPAPDPHMGRPRQGSQPRAMGYDAYPHAPFMPDSRGGPYPPQARGGRRSESGHRPSPGEMYGRRESPGRPMPPPMHSNRTSRDTSPSSRFPPRKSSLGQQQTPVEPFLPGAASASTRSETPEESKDSSAPKPLPFIRPADIYKRMEEEKERQRRQSQDSNRPSADSPKLGAASVPPPAISSDGRDSLDSPRRSLEQRDSSERAPRSKPILDPVTERKSEYGFDKMLKDSPYDHRSAGATQSAESAPSAEPPSATSEHGLTYASSQYSDRPDPVSASSVKSKQSFTHGGPDIVRVPTQQEIVEDDQPTPRPAEGSNKSDSQATSYNLQHQASLGYRSLVNQAFEDSETRVLPTPASNSDSLPRSGSASTSDISPILSRHSSSATQLAGAGGQRDAPPTIPEEPAHTASRPTSSDTTKPTEVEYKERPLTPPPGVRPGYRRNASTPSPNNSPARRPVSVETGDIPKSELATMAMASPTTSRKNDEHIPAETNPLEGHRPLTPPQLAANRTMDERKGLSISRSESPTKGKVRDIAGKFNDSSISSPSGSPQKQSPRPSNARLESFRPALPGSWMSYTTNEEYLTPSRMQSEYVDAGHANMSANFNEATETPAHQGEGWPSSTPEVVQNNGSGAKSFTATAAMSPAQAGAFPNLSSALGDEATKPETKTMNRSMPTGVLPRDVSHPVHESDLPNARIEPVSTAARIPPAPLPKDTPHEVTDSSRAEYFPLPLKANEPAESTPKRPQMLPALSTDMSPEETENDRLQKAILKDLTPHSAHAEESADQNIPKTPTKMAPSARHEKAESTTIPEEYNNYWDDISQSPNLALKYPSSHLDGRDSSRETPTKDLPPIPQSQGKSEPPRQVKKRFSWESSSSEENVDVPMVAPLTPHSPQQPRPDIPNTAHKVETTESSVPYQEPSSPPVPRRSTETPTNTNLTTVVDRRPSETDTFASSQDLHARTEPPVSGPSQTPFQDAFDIKSTDQDPAPPITPEKDPLDSTVQTNKDQNLSFGTAGPTVMSYREISALKTPQDRISAFNSAREQYVSNHTGLGNWLQSTSQMLPEHADVVLRNGRLSQKQAAHLGHKLSPSRSKFPRIVSLTGAIQPSQGGTSNSPSSAADPSSSGIHQMQEDGKKLLQSAGKLGGRAGGAAKGLIMKGKSKFRQSGGGEKARSKSQTRTISPSHSSLAIANAQLISTMYAKQSTAKGPPPAHTQENSIRSEQQPPDHSAPVQSTQTEHLQEPRVVVTSAPNDSPKANRLPRNFDEVSALGSQDGDAVPSRSISEVTQPRNSQENSHNEEVHDDNPDVTEVDQARDRSLANETPKAERTSIVEEGSHGTRSDAEEANTSGNEGLHSTITRNTSDLSVNVGQQEKAVVASVLKPPAMVNIPSRTGINQPSAHGLHLWPEKNRSSPNRPEHSSPLKISNENVPLATNLRQRNASPSVSEEPVTAQPAAADMSPPTAYTSTPPKTESTQWANHNHIASKESNKSQERQQVIPHSVQDSQSARNSAFMFRIHDNQQASGEQVPTAVGLDANNNPGPNQLDLSQKVTPQTESSPENSRDPSLSRLSPEPQRLISNTTAPVDQPFPDRRQRQSYSRPFKEPDITTHPAYRESSENIDRRSQVYASEDPPQEPHYDPSYRPANKHSQVLQDAGVYRIPGPYGQQYRSPRQQAFPPSGFSPTDPTTHTQNRTPAGDIQRGQRFDENGNAITSTQYTGPRPRSQDRSYVPRPISVEYEIPGVGPPPPEPSPPKQRPRSGIFSRARSRSRPPILNDDASDTVENLFRDEQPRERRSSIFSRRSSKQASASKSLPQVSGSQTPRKSSTMPVEQPERSKKSNKLQRSSTSGVSEGETKRQSGRSRWSGIFSRSKSTIKNSPTPEIQPFQSSQIDEHGYNASYRPQREASPKLPDLSQMHAQTLPPKPGRGYYAVYSSQNQAQPPSNSFHHQQSRPNPEYNLQHDHPPRSGVEGFVGGRQLSERQVANEKHNSESGTGFRGPYHAQPSPKRSPPNLRINTESNKHRPVSSQSSSHQLGTQAYTAPPGGPSRHSPYAATSPSQTSPYGYGSARGLNSTSLSHTIDLQKRSRSPRGGRRNSVEEDEPYRGPAHALGTFSNRSSMRKSGDGEQEGPWRIDIPHDKENKDGENTERDRENGGGRSMGQDSSFDNGEPARGRHRESVPVQRIDAAGNEGHIADQQKMEGRAELQGSRVPGDESEDDVVMSSTAYPGQEWMPSGYGWDD